MAPDTSLCDSLARGGGVVVNGVRKLYGSFEAIKGVSLRMKRGEVTALLGHNGAGKSTLSNVLCCEQSPTDGDVFVFGTSVVEDPYAVRRLVGVCKQDDFLWPDLSAKEHLDLFAGLRGVDPKQQAEIVQNWLESVDLSNVQFQFSAAFSGGMKRRLSVALSTIGDRPLIILDEPTTGMDPVSRRFVWRHIDEIKEGRVVLLTTHAMEEADLLSDTVAVMRKGELAAFGSPLELKSQHGSALQFSVLVNKSDVAATENIIRDHFNIGSDDFVSIEAGEAGNITVNIQRIKQDANEEGVDVAVLSDFVAWLDSDESRVSEYGFSNSSLEEVFLNLTASEEEEKEEDDERECVNVCCGFCCAGCILCCPKCHTYHEHSDDTPEMVEENGELEESRTASTRNLATFKPELSVRKQVETLVRHSFARHWTGRGSIANYVLFSVFVLLSFIMGFTFVTSTVLAGLALPTVVLSLMLLSIISPIYSDRAQGVLHLMRTQGLLARSYVLGTGLYAFFIQLIFGFVLLSLFYGTPLFRETIVCDQGDYRCYSNFGDPPMGRPSQIYSLDGGDFNEESVTLYAIRTAGGYEKVLGTIVFFALTLPGAVLSSSYLPGNKFAVICVVFIALLCSVIPLLKYILPMNEEDAEKCITNICGKEDWRSETTSSEDFLNCVGLNINLYQATSLCTPAYAAILPQFGVFQTLAMNLMSDIKFTSEPAGYVEQVLIPSMQGGGADCSGSICQFPYAQRLYGQNLGYQLLGAVILLILGVMIATISSFPTGIVLEMKHRVSREWSRLRSLVRCERRDYSHDKNQETEFATEEVLEEVVIERDIIRELVRPFLKEADLDAIEAGNDELVRPVVINHASISRDDLPPVVMHKLHKVYPSLGGLPPKVALKSLDMHVPKGQVLGLLGKNGAGKTTALKILSTSHESSGGIALVAGYDVNCEQISVFESLGNCPQFDVIWSLQSVQSHLEFFARLKGLPRAQVADAAHSIATAVGLGAPEVYRRNAGALSGGMRRRLSIAISLIGAPSVLLLDEPSTGLDPSTRNSIWGLINSFATEERAIIITTHMMIEADTLCNRIAIVSRGQLKVVATQQHLKDKFGSGYLLQLNLVHSTPTNQESAMNFVRNNLHKDAVLENKQAKTLHISLPRDLDLQKVFAALYSPDSTSEGCINQFLLSQSSLEDVFLALGD